MPKCGIYWLPLLRKRTIEFPRMNFGKYQRHFLTYFHCWKRYSPSSLRQKCKKRSRKKRVCGSHLKKASMPSSAKWSSQRRCHKIIMTEENTPLSFLLALPFFGRSSCCSRQGRGRKMCLLFCRLQRNFTFSPFAYFRRPRVSQFSHTTVLPRGQSATEVKCGRRGYCRGGKRPGSFACAELLSREWLLFPPFPRCLCCLIGGLGQGLFVMNEAMLSRNMQLLCLYLWAAHNSSEALHGKARFKGQSQPLEDLVGVEEVLINGALGFLRVVKHVVLRMLLKSCHGERNQVLRNTQDTEQLAYGFLQCNSMIEKNCTVWWLKPQVFERDLRREYTQRIGPSSSSTKRACRRKMLRSTWAA